MTFSALATRVTGARIGRRVYVNTLFISDHNLLEFGDDVVIGADADWRERFVSVVLSPEERTARPASPRGPLPSTSWR